ncbi:Uncharacterised protein, partial [Mycoplasma putrefaciens]
MFSNFTQLLTQKDFDKLINTIKRIQEFNPSLTFIFLNDSLRYVQDLSKLIYTVNNNNLELLSAEKIFDLGLDYDYQINFNNLKYQKTKLGQIEVENKNW